MKPNLDALRQKQQSLLHEMQTTDRLRRGSLSCQFFPATGPRVARRGPYYVLQGFFRGQKFSEHIPPDKPAKFNRTWTTTVVFKPWPRTTSRFPTS